MSEWGIEDGVQPGNQNANSDGPKALRDAYDALKTKNQELQDGLASIQKELRDQRVSATLTQLGIPADAANQYQGEADPEKVREWATSMRALFGNGSPQAPAAPAVTTPAPTQTLTPAQQAQVQNFSEAGQEGQPVGNFEASVGRISDATSTQDLIATWQNIK